MTKYKNSFTAISIILLAFIAVPSFGQHHRRNKNDKKETLMPWQIDTLIKPIPINRQMFTDRITAEIRKADLKDGSLDNKIDLDDTLLSKALTYVFLQKAPLVMIHIENLEKADHQQKIKYHRALNDLLFRLNNRRVHNGDYSYYKRSIDNFEDLIIATEEDKVPEFVKENADIYTLDNSELLDNFPNEKAYVFEVVGKENPVMMIKRLPEFAKEAYADPIVAAAAKVVPGTILTYATSTSYLATVVRRNQDPLVQTIARIASESKSPLRALPFLDDIYAKRKTIAQVDQLTKDEKSYYKALVQLKIDDHKIGAPAVEEELNYRGLQFVRVANALHESPNPVRFNSLMDFNAAELYFMMIGSQDEIYTSSFTWMFDRMMEQMKPEKGDAFLDRIHHANFRTFIRMCAGYNKLTPFFQTMPEESKNDLMKQFVANLEKGPKDELEDAVDVADAFGSITNPDLIKFLKKEVKSNYERVYKAKNAESTKGVIIYGLLSTIFNNADNSDQLSGNLSLIPPITYVPISELKDKNGTINIQAFFYGDEDGAMSFNSFKSHFQGSKWTSVSNKSWITFTYSGSPKIVVYANFPLAEPEDETAQNALAAYLESNNINPTIVIHRGHSYHLDGSLKNLTPEVKVVMLGSCGGYHNLAKVLDKAPDANIISSKQVGSVSVNEPIISEIFTQLIEGHDLNWISAWSDLNTYFGKRDAREKDLFSDYVPPNKNLGAIFIKAYRKLSTEDID